MRAKDFVSLGKELLPGMPSFRLKGALIFAAPVDHVVRGLHFEGSSFDRSSFYLNVFFQPLCVPRKHLHFTLGFRLRDSSGSTRWDSNQTSLLVELKKAIAATAMPFLESARTLEGAAAAAEAMNSSNPHVLEAAAFCRALSGEANAAFLSLNAISSVVDRGIAWQAEVADEAELIGRLLRDDPANARKQLLTWERDTARNVSIESFRPE